MIFFVVIVVMVIIVVVDVFVGDGVVAGVAFVSVLSLLL